MNGGDLTAFSGQPERLGADAEVRGRLGQVEPGLDPVRGGSVDWNMMVGTQRRHTLARPAITVAGYKLIPIQEAGDEIVIGDQNQMPDGGKDIR